MADAPRHLVVVPHTHWDREWYLTHEQFRHRLVPILDGLLALLEGDPEFRHFTLDGQTIVVDDYLEVRPRARERIEKLVRDGRLLVGPWHVLPDEWLVSGEALIRNLRFGRRRALELGGVMPVGYVPDPFGHVGQLPQLLAGFGLEGAVVWRGVGAHVDRTLFRWEAPDGTGLTTVYLPRGYGNAADLPLAPDALAQRLEAEVRALEPFSAVSTLLLMNGMDHGEPQAGLPAALREATAHLVGVEAEIGTLPGFLRRARAEAEGALPRHRGELRSGLRAPLLVGCASARAPQKRAEFENDRLLTRYLEPLAAWLAALGGDADPEWIDFAWRVALENHPHDSVCGCSVDAVHEQMDARFRRVKEIATAHLQRVAAELAARVAPPGAPAEEDCGTLVVWNPNAGGHAQVEASVELDLPAAGRARRAPRLHLRDAGGRRIPVHAERVAPAERLLRLVLPKSLLLLLLPGLQRELFGAFVNGVAIEDREGRLELRVRLGSAPEPGFDPQEARRRVEAALAPDDVERVRVDLFRPARLALRFVDALPGHGLRVYRVGRGAAPGGEALRAERRPDGGAAIENASWRIEADARGRVTLHSRRHGCAIPDALRLVSEADRGDEYNFDPLPEGERVERPERVRVRVVHASSAEVALRIDARYRVSAGLDPDRRTRSTRRVGLPVRLELRLAPGLDRIDVLAEVDNRARDQRLRLHARAPFAAQRFEVESAFEIADRPIAPAPDAFGPGPSAERPIGTVPQRTFATLADARLAWTVANRGVTEVEAVPEGDGRTSLALTILRAVGWLSRHDLALRPGPAGPPLPTPGAQVPGPHRVELALRLHEPGEARRAAEAHAFAHPPLAILGSGAPDAPLRDGARLVEVDDPCVVISAIEPRRNGSPVLRLCNLAAEPRRVTVRWCAGGNGSFEALDLAERPDAHTPVEPHPRGAALLALRPWQITTLRPR